MAIRAFLLCGDEKAVHAVTQILDELEVSFEHSSEPPFALTLGNVTPSSGAAWERDYTVTVEPPQGTGEKYVAVQKYRCTSVAGNLATIALTTHFRKVPENPLDRVPLLQRQPQGQSSSASSIASATAHAGHRRAPAMLPDERIRCAPTRNLRKCPQQPIFYLRRKTNSFCVP